MSRALFVRTLPRSQGKFFYTVTPRGHLVISRHVKLLFRIACAFAGWLFICLPCHAQTARPPFAPTVVNFAARAFDAAQTCHALANHGHEDFLPTQSCGGVVAFSAGFAVSSYGADWWLRKHGHNRLAQFQWFSAAGAGGGIAYSFGVRLRL